MSQSLLMNLTAVLKSFLIAILSPEFDQLQIESDAGNRICQIILVNIPYIIHLLYTYSQKSLSYISKQSIPHDSPGVGSVVHVPGCLQNFRKPDTKRD